ncbi:uncharacterized protein LOC104893977 isoform X2 [Beta vulgaris subsp. vulgaris]|nr:uncharacterized protein LOC104893977 isoform X2 [Beta vulgaris subsp. vulgaris]XP_057251171.1 uncharacterized protein LOC104893977 isoform X2 [Beta vulgaris subsp. vulgaris]
MVESKSAIENLPLDALRQIMVRVAEPPNGAIEILHTFYMCKAFQDFSEDEDILSTVVFEDLSTYCLSLCDPFSVHKWEASGSPDISSQFQAFQHIGGFVHRAAKTGNLSAQLILAKLILMSTSELLHAKNEASNPEVPPQNDKDDKLSRRAKASSLVAHFTGQATDANTEGKLLHYELVKKLLIQADLEEIQNVKPYLQDYISYFLHPAVKSHHDKFLTLLEELDEIHTTIFLRATAESFARAFNNLCVTGSKTMLALGVNLRILRALKLSLVKEKDYFSPDNLIERFGTVENLLKEGLKEATGRGRELEHADPRAGPISKMIERIHVVKESLFVHLRLIEFIAVTQADMITEFDAFFSI